MIIKKHVLFSEVLYIWSNYEKGRCNPKRLWSKGYKRELMKSIESMGIIINALCENDVLPFDKLVIKLIIEKQDFLRIDKSIITSLESEGYKLLPLHLDDNMYGEVNQTMKTIIESLKTHINSLNRSGKKSIWYLLHALHNLPRVYFDLNEKSLTGIPLTPISCLDALQYAKMDLSNI